MFQVSLNGLIEEFRKSQSVYAEQRAALDQCDTLSRRFIDFATVSGYTELKDFFFLTYEKNNPDPVLYQARKNESGDHVCDGHVVVDAGLCYIDWSARQYSKQTDFPHIIVKQEAMHL